jgi:hypothetical protein
MVSRYPSFTESLVSGLFATENKKARTVLATILAEFLDTVKLAVREGFEPSRGG